MGTRKHIVTITNNQLANLAADNAGVSRQGAIAVRWPDGKGTVMHGSISHVTDAVVQIMDEEEGLSLLSTSRDALPNGTTVTLMFG